MRVLVCGSRTWDDADLIFTVLHGLYGRCYSRTTAVERLVIIEGVAPGADAIAASWVRANPGLVDHLSFPADWGRHGKAAGPIRNQQMLDEGKPELVVAFSETNAHGFLTAGTQDMVHRAKRAGVPVWVIGHG